ncbi:SU10 major capsid protein [Desulfallas thermosapovorans]|uniref:Uncharacterized protein n=1 Tax=Desulfallas thermosapovorans DSM 6562 TaxID=1121431 RepID=A0A5S4ZQZ1_9FIRM|nr:DUF5309 family protein [Desulfallas thermosapovorans]TYO95132.1 hypothetical protein LX24_01861 [Desulfallas thermosapovorans DSM 6562]
MPPVLTFDLDTQRRDLDVARDIARYMPDETPWTVMLLQSRKKGTQTAQFFWWEEDVYGYWTQVNSGAGYDDTATDIVVDDASIFAPKDILKIPRTGEVMFVSAVNTGTNTITVMRGYGETAAAAINDDDYVLCLGNAMEERSSAPQEKILQPVKMYNYCGITRTTFGGSGTVLAEQQVTNEQERARLTRDKGVDHRLSLERMLLFGERKEDATNKRRMSRGIEKFITTNVYDAGGEMTEADFDQNVCEPVFKYGTKRKVLVASPRMVSIINGFAKDKLQVSQGAKEYGLDLQEYISPHGRLVIAPSRILEQYYAYHSFVIDMKYVSFRALRDTKLRRNIQAPDVDGFLDEYLTEAGLEFRVEKAHMTIKNATG